MSVPRGRSICGSCFLTGQCRCGLRMEPQQYHPEDWHDVRHQAVPLTATWSSFTCDRDDGLASKPGKQGLLLCSRGFALLEVEESFFGAKAWTSRVDGRLKRDLTVRRLVEKSLREYAPELKRATELVVYGYICVDIRKAMQV